MKKPEPVLVIIVPCYNEEDVLPETTERLSSKLDALVCQGLVSEKSAVLFVDDGSDDNTWNLIETFHAVNPRVCRGLRLGANMGHQRALLCGLLSVREYADITVTIDADLQDDTDAIDLMLRSYFSGKEIVLGVRSGREADAFPKRVSAAAYYAVMRFLGAGLVANHADFRLMSRGAVNALADFTRTERGKGNLFLRGIVPALGFTTGVVYYERKKRLAGKSKYTLWKMVGLASAGIAFVRVFRPLRHGRLSPGSG